MQTFRSLQKHYVLHIVSYIKDECVAILKTSAMHLLRFKTDNETLRVSERNKSIRYTSTSD